MSKQFLRERRARTLVAVKHSHWGKVNLVTISDKTGLYDLYKCEDCGYKEKCYGFQRSRKCPKCKNVISEGRDIIGSWAHISNVGKSSCPKCDAIMVEVPKEGHPNSKYLNLKRCGDEVLVSCPNNCLED